MSKGIIRRVNAGYRQAMLEQFRQAKAEFRELAEAEAETIQADFEDVVSDWQPENQPRFVREVTVQPDKIRILVRPDKRQKAGKVFDYVDKGTEPHTIKPKKAKALAFIWGGSGSYQAKTTPVAQAHVGSGQVAGGTPHVLKQVHHPGSKAREFSETLHQQSTRRFRRDAENLFRRLARRLNNKG